MRLHNCKYVLATGTTGRYAGCDLLKHPEVNELYCLWNCGFYSNQVQVFSSLLTLARHGIVPDKIDYSMGYKHFKKDPNRDLYPDFHQTNPSQEIEFYKEVEIPDANKCQLDLYDWDLYGQIVKRYFNPSGVVRERWQLLTEKYNINPEETIAVLYRGTDKKTELKLASPDEYFKVVTQLLEKNPTFKVLLQTAQAQIIKEWQQKLGDRLIFFQETPSTDSSSPIWDLMEKSGGDSTNWSQWFDAALRCVSECKYVVNHTGNVAFFMNLYRGNTEGVYQFNEFGYMPSHLYPGVE